MSKTKKQSVSTLRSLCLAKVIENFSEIVSKRDIPQNVYHDVVSRLPVTLPPHIGAKFISDESYWERCCHDKYKRYDCNIINHGNSWKQLYFEKYLTSLLESFHPEDDFTELLTFVTCIQDYVYTLTFKQLPSHMDLSKIIELLPKLTKIDISYNYKNLGMNYDRLLFGMKISDAKYLSVALSNSTTVTHLSITESLIDDDILRVLMTSLIENESIQNLNFSHNKISDAGARLFGKLFIENSILRSLNLTDNHIQVEGGKFLARGLYDGGPLQELILRMNDLYDVGCQYIIESIWAHKYIQKLNLSCNGAGALTAQAIGRLFTSKDSILSDLNVSGNEFLVDDIILFHHQLKENHNQTLFYFDLRNNPGYIRLKSAAAVTSAPESSYMDEGKTTETINILEEIEDMIHDNMIRHKYQHEFTVTTTTTTTNNNTTSVTAAITSNTMTNNNNNNNNNNNSNNNKENSSAQWNTRQSPLFTHK